jgi:hypothetical protein
VRLRHVERRIEDRAAVERVQVRVLDQPGISIRGSLMFIQKLRVNGRFSFSSTQTTPTLRIAAMRAFSSAGQVGHHRHEVRQRDRRDHRVEAALGAGDAHADDPALVADRDAEHRLDAGRELDRAAELLSAARRPRSSSTSEPPSM